MRFAWVPPEARWSQLKANVKNPAIGTRIDLLRKMGDKSRDLLHEYFGKEKL